MAAKPAFTIIELLITVAIIGLLAALGIQNFTASRIRAHDTNVKGTVRSYRQAMEVYYSQYKTYFVYDHNPASGGCVASYTSGMNPASHTAYGLIGNGNGCVGLNGGSEGQMTRRKSPELAKYRTKSIADALVGEGVLSSIETYPSVDTFDKNNKIAGSTLPADFVLTLCDDKGQEAQSDKTATNFAIYATPKKTTPVENSTASQLCGSSGTPHGWTITAVE